MSLVACPGAIHIGVLASEPIRLAGLAAVFDQAGEQNLPRLVPVVGTLEQLLENRELEYLIVDLNSPSGGMQTLERVRRARPSIRQIVIGPEKQDELVMDAIVAGARAYLDSSAAPETVRKALDVVVSGSIWAPRRLLSTLIDRLLGEPDGGSSNLPMQLTTRERQVLDLILRARSNREIALELGIEERTVKAHVCSLMRKTGSVNRLELSMRTLNKELRPANQHGTTSNEG